MTIPWQYDFSDGFIKNFHAYNIRYEQEKKIDKSIEPFLSDDISYMQLIFI